MKLSESIWYLLISGILALSTLAFTARADLAVENMGQQFVSRVPSDWHVEQGGWEYFDILDCFTTPGKSCSGNNPTSPYGFPTFLDELSGLPISAFQLNQDEAIVIFLRTPPKSRYFAYTQYLVQSADALIPEFGSLSDSLNQLKIKTSHESGNDLAFSEYAVLVWTPDLLTQQRVEEMLVSQGVAPEMINFIPLPTAIPNHSFHFGYGAAGDYFGMLLRVALPDSQAELDAYIKEIPYYVVRLGPNTTGRLEPSPVLGFSSEISGRVESMEYPKLSAALDLLVADIKRKYSSSFQLTSSSVTFNAKTGWDCILGESTCAGDNYDALYSRDTGTVKVTHLQDFVLVVGVNHQKTGKAAYLNHTVYDLKKLAGIVSVADPQLTHASAVYHAGIDPRSSRALLYKNLYAYMISYDCAGRSFCIEIPAPTPDNPVGLEPGTPFAVTGRSYLEPISKVRPALIEIIPHQAFLGTLK